MKQILDRVVIVFWIVILAAAFYAQDYTAPQPTTLSGEKAVEQLKNTGRYDSLKAAFNAARGKDGQPGSPTPEGAVGETAKVIFSNGTTNNYFGNAVAIQGDLAVVGAPGYLSDTGAAYVFQQSGTAWTQQAILTASDGAAGDLFGWSVAISGDSVIVGAFEASSIQGAAYVFVQNGSNWSQQAKLTADSPQNGDRFGSGVAIYGDTAIVGAFLDDDQSSNHGSAYVFERTGSTWTRTQQLFGSTPGTDDQFGYSVALSGGTAVIGAPMRDVGSHSDQGSAFVFVYSGSTWVEQAELTAGTEREQVGASVAVSGDTAILGAPLTIVGGNQQGSAYVFTRSGVTWSQQAQLTASDGQADDFFGSSVGISGDRAVVGAYPDDVTGEPYQGSAYVFERTGSVWTQVAKLTANEDGGDDWFGYSAAISGNNIIIGSPLDDIGANADQGSAFIYRVLGTGWTQESQTVPSGAAAGDSFGISVAISGDTAVVGASTHDDVGGADQGSAYVFVRSGSAWTQQAILLAGDGAAGDLFGTSVAISADTVVVGAPADDVGTNADQGSAYVFVRTGSTWPQQGKLIDGAGGTNPGDGFGISVAISADTVIVGAYLYDLPLNVDQGAFVVFTRSSGSWSQRAKLTSTSASAGDHFGVSVAFSGGTVVVGANKDTVGGVVDQGSAYVFTGSGGFWTEQAQLFGNGGLTGDEFGTSVSISGNTAIIGANKDDVNGNADQGSAFVFTRSGNSWSQEAQLTDTNGAQGDEFGISVSLNGDAAVVGAYKDDVGGNVDQGSALVFIRSGVSWTQQTQLNSTGGTGGDQFGRSVALSGDKIVVGAPLSDVSVSVPLAPQAADQGAAFFFVNSFIPTAAPVSIGGRVLAPNGYGLRNAIVILTLESGERRRAITGSFGYFRFDGIEAGQTVVVSIVSKRFQFVPQIVSLGEDVTDLTFTPQ